MNDVDRFIQFSQFKTQIRGSMAHLIVGIDIAKDKHHAFFGTANGKTLWRRLIFSNDLLGYTRLIEQTQVLSSQYQLGEVVFGLEPTSNYHKPLAYWLIKQQYLVVMVAGKAVKDNRELLDGRWDKNDIKDSANVADLISQGKCQFYEQPDEDIVGVRNLLVIRKQLKREDHRLRMRIRNGLIAKYFPEMDRFWGHRLEENLAIVRWYLDPRKISDTEFEEFVRHVTTTNRGVRQMQRLRAIHQAAGESVGMPMDEAAGYEAQLLVERLRQVKEQISQTMQHLESKCQNLSGYQLLLTIPGFGPYIAALVLGALASPFRFTSRKQVIRLAGLDLNASRSGKKSQDSVPKISKRGNADLRYALYQAALIASYHNDGFRRLYHRTLEGRHGERGIKTKARVKLSAKMLVVAWTMLKNNEPFDARRLLGESVQQR
ncbi:Mobile element protein [Olavius algarvensis Delta 1 endosymbiont]|nr:Mobile element protein [Olavius algarvensis Delta 1 endosymbiont]